MPRERLFWPLVLVGSALLTLACFHRVLGYGFTDKDTLLHITEARVESPGDLAALPFKKLTGGRAARDANFYRPTVMLVYAGLRRAFGWEPFGYHAFDLGLYALNGWLLALFAATCARRTGLAGPRRFGLLCAAIFLVHPLGVETVPAIARNGDLLVTAGFLASLLVLDRADRALARGDAWRSPRVLGRLGAFTALYALTLGSKEPGIVLLGAAFLFVAIVAVGEDTRRRALRAGGLVLPCLAITAGYFALRMRVMGEALGGYDVAFPLPVMAHLVANAMPMDLGIPGYAHAIPPLLGRLGIEATPDSLWPLGLSVAALLLWGLLVRIASPHPAPGAVARFLCGPRGRLVAFVGLVIVAHAALFVLTDVYDRRLLCTVAAFWSFLPALAVHWALEGWRRPRRLPALAALAAGVVLFGLQSPLIHRYDEWRDSGEAAYLLTERLRRRWEKVPDGATVTIFNMPTSISTEPMRRVMFANVSSTNTLAPNAVKAWLEDQFPDKTIWLRAFDFTRYLQPLSGFRHRAHVVRGWLLFRTPQGAKELDDAAESWPQFQTATWGADRMRVAYRRRPIPPEAYVLVFDGRSSLLLPAAKLPGRRASRRSRPGG